MLVVRHPTGQAKVGKAENCKTAVCWQIYGQSSSSMLAQSGSLMHYYVPAVQPNFVELGAVIEYWLPVGQVTLAQLTYSYWLYCN